MFIQLVRCRVKPDAWPQVEAWLRRWQAEEAPSCKFYEKNIVNFTNKV
jgi:hypothetical protein